MSVQARIEWTGGYLAESGALKATARIGRTGGLVGRLVLEDGTGAGQANQVFEAAFSIPATTMRLYDLKGGGGELDVLNAPMAMTAVKLVIVELTTPAAGTSVRFGPQNQTNAAQLWFQAATANFYDTVLDKLFQADSRAGWALDNTHKVIGLYNPGASTVAGRILVAGTK